MALLLWKPCEPVKPKNQVTSQHYQAEETNEDYRSYDLLPQQQVTPIPEQAVPEAKSQDSIVLVEAPRPEVTEPESTLEPGREMTEAPQPAPASYILQVRRFDDPVR